MKMLKLIIDRVLVPIVLLSTYPFRQLRNKRFSPNGASQHYILISFFGRGLGDCVYFSGILKELRKKYPDSKFHLAIFTQMKDYFIRNPYLDEIIICPDYYQRPLPETWKYLRSAFRERKKRQYDLLINLVPTLFSMPGLWDFIIKKKFSIGLTDSLKKIFYDLPIQINWNKHFFDAILEGATPLSIHVSNPSFWAPTEDNVSKLLPSHMYEKKLIILAPGGKRIVEEPLKRSWAFSEFPHVIRHLTNRGYPVVLVGASYDKKCLIDLEEHPLLLNLIGKTTIPQLFALVKNHTKLVLCNNSALLHIASILSIPTVSYADAEANLDRWYPYLHRDNHVILKESTQRRITADLFIESLDAKLQLIEKRESINAY